MLRNFTVALALILLSEMALGLGLGTLKQSSSLNEPFAGRIEILGATAGNFDTIVVKLADSEQFERAGVRRNAVLLQLRFKIIEGAAGKDYIQISSRDPIREPFLNFLLELDWAKGRIIREYTVLLDPPLYDPVRRKVETAPPAAAPAQPTPTPSQVAETMTDPTPTVEQEPSAIYGAGATIGPIQVNDTLWSIASANLPDGSTSVQQMMLAILRVNPEAFGNDNINILKRGAILRMPEQSELTALSQRDAIEEVRRQHQLWNDYRNVATESVAEEPLGADTAPIPDDELFDDEMDAADDGTMVGDPRLELVAPQADDDQMGAGADADITLAREEIDAQVQENAELQARISEANEIIELMERQVDIRDDELAAMQARLAELGIEAPADMAAAGEPGEMVDADAMDDGVAEMDIDIMIGDEAPVSDVDALPPPDDIVELGVEDEPEMAADDGAGAVPENGRSTVGGLIPEPIANMVPGGTLTILGVLGVIVLAIIAALFKLIGRRPKDTHDAELPRDDTTSLTEGIDEVPITETTHGDVDAVVDENPTQVATDFAQTLEATATNLLPEVSVEQTDDPLEEVNVYLAYERFDQAENLVRTVIDEHPNEHQYKLRLLEVFYSSNNKGAYEEAARPLHDAVGEDDPLWESAVAMWSEMSPERALFAEGGAATIEEATSADEEEPTKAFVDITAIDEPEDDAGVSTMSMAPGSDALLESTQINLREGPDDGEDPGSLDFDLGAAGAEATDDEVLDLTATTDSLEGDEEILDRTAISSDTDNLLDLTAGMEDLPDTQSDEFDPGITDELTDGDDLLDLTAPQADDEHDLLDVTKTGAQGDDQRDDALNVTAPGLLDDHEPDANEISTVIEEASNIDFDISDTVSPAFDIEEEPAAEEEIFDVTTPPSPEAVPAADDILDFDIAGLEDTATDTDTEETIDIGGGDVEFDSGDDQPIDVGLDIGIGDDDSAKSQDDVETIEMDVLESDTAAADKLSPSHEKDDGIDLSLQSSDLDDHGIADDIGAAPGSDTESEIEFDLALQDTTDMDSLIIDDTLELPKASVADESLEDLTKSMEESMADLDLGDGDLDVSDLGETEGELDLSLADTSGGLDIDFSETEGGDTASNLDFNLDEFNLENEDHDDINSGTASGANDTVVTTADESAAESDTDEIDTKLNLAKAYIELGDNDGARSILDEVERDGSDDQKAEAQRLIEQLT